MTCLPLSKAIKPENKPISYNSAQQAAINAGPGPILVLAGPGTGKTQTLMGRIASLIEEGEPRVASSH